MPTRQRFGVDHGAKSQRAEVVAGRDDLLIEEIGAVHLRSQLEARTGGNVVEREPCPEILVLLAAMTSL